MSQVSLKSFLGSERQGGSTGYATAVDFRSLQFHNKIASFAVAAHTLEPLLVEYLAEGAQRDGTVEVAVADELGLDLGGGEEMDGARLLAQRTGQVEVDVEELLLGCAVGKLLHVLAEQLYLLGGEPVDEARPDQPDRLGIEPGMVDGMVEGRVDVLHVEGEEAAVARLVGEELELVARGAVGGHAHAPLLGGTVGGTYIDVGCGDERLEVVEVGIGEAVELVVVDQGKLGAAQLLVLVAEVGARLAAAVVDELVGDEGIEPGALEDTLRTDEHEHLVVHRLRVHPRGHHRHEPLAEAGMPEGGEAALLLLLVGILLPTGVGSGGEGGEADVDHGGHPVDIRLFADVALRRPVEIVGEGVDLGDAVAHQGGTEGLPGDVHARLDVAGQQQRVDVAVGQVGEVRALDLMGDEVELQSLAAEEVGGQPDLHVALPVALLPVLAAGQRLAPVHGGRLLVASRHERGYRLLAILRAVLLLHELRGVLLLHAEVGERHGQPHEEVVAVARGELSRRRAVDALLGVGEDLLGRPCRRPLLFGDGLVVGDALFLAAFACHLCHVDLEGHGIGIEPRLGVVTDGGAMVGLAHGGVVVGGDGVGNQLVALDEGLLVDLGCHAAVGYLVEVEDVEPLSAHAHMIQGHEGQLPDAPLGLLHQVGGDMVEVALAEAGIALEVLHVATLAEAGGRHHHRELFGLELFELFGGQFGLDGLAVVEGALAQHLVVSDFLVHLTEGDVVVGQRTETAGVHGNEGLVHRFCL